MTLRAGLTLAVTAAFALAMPSAASAAPPSPGGYQQDDFAPGSSFNIAHPGKTATRAAPTSSTS